MHVSGTRDLGALVREVRLHRGLTQEGLAREVGVRRQWVVQVERGTGNPNWLTLRRLLDVLDLHVDISPAETPAQGSVRASEPDAGNASDRDDLDALLAGCTDSTR